MNDSTKREHDSLGFSSSEDSTARRISTFDRSPLGIFLLIVGLILTAIFIGLMIYGFITVNPMIGLFVAWVIALFVTVLVWVLRDALRERSWMRSEIPEYEREEWNDDSDDVDLAEDSESVPEQEVK